MEIKLVPVYGYNEEINALFSEYTQLLIEGDSTFQQYLEQQHYDLELQNPAEKYGPPGGRLYLALRGEEAAGCIALKQIDAQACELKRLYVRPRFRGEKIGELLARQVIADAREIGYAYIRLDTLPFLASAIHIYEKMGFYRTGRYNDSPMDSSIYMRLDL